MTELLISCDYSSLENKMGVKAKIVISTLKKHRNKKTLEFYLNSHQLTGQYLSI